MTTSTIPATGSLANSIGRYRWVICGLLFLATTINYIDRQVLALIKGTLDTELGWTNTQFGWTNAAFQLAYAVSLFLFGWFIDRKGVKIGFLQYTAKWYAQDQQIATAARPGVARMLSKDGSTIDENDLARLREDIRRLRPLVDVLIVSSHNRDGFSLPMPADMLAETRPLSASPRPDDPSLFAPIPLGARFMQAEAYEKLLAHAAIDAGADIVYGHGSHVLQGVEVYKGKPVMYCLGNFATDWIRMRPNKDGLVARVIVEDRKVARVSLTPVTRDAASNNVRMLNATDGEGAGLMQKVRALSGETPLPVDGQETVLIARGKP